MTAGSLEHPISTADDFEVSWALLALGYASPRATGQNVSIGVIDSGIGDHLATQLGVVVMGELDDHGHSVPNGLASDNTGHGTGTASLIAGTHDGVFLGAAPGARLVVAKVIEGGWSIVRILAGLDWMLDQNVRIVSLCVGLPVPNPVFGPILARLRQAGILVVCPVGNCGPTEANPPGDDPSVLSVGAIDREGCVAAFSGSRHGLSFADTHAPDVLAPGVDVPTLGLDGAIVERSGTSMAAALVVGVSAWLMSEVPDANAEHVRRAICHAAARDDSREARTQSRWGRVDAAAALALLRSGGALEPDDVPRAHPTTAIPPSQRLLRQIRESEDGEPVAGVFVLTADAAEQSDAVEGLLARARRDGGTGEIIKALPRARAIVVSGTPDFLYALIDDPTVWLASAVDASPLFDRLYDPSTGRTIFAAL